MNLIAVLFCILAVIHFLPAVAAIAPAQLSNLYGVAPDNTVLRTLLQHRAILLGLVGAAFLAAALVPSLRWAALIGGTLSMALFLVIAFFNDELTGTLSKITLVDAAGLPIAAILFFLLSRGT